MQADLSASLSPDALPPILDDAVYAASPARSTDEAYGAAYLDGWSAGPECNVFGLSLVQCMT